MRIRWATVPVTVGATLALTAAAAFGATIMVDQDGAASPGNCAGSGPAFTTIQAGVNAASPGDTVEVCGAAAPYAGATVNTPDVHLLGVNDPVVADPGNTAITLNGNNDSISKFRITNSATGITTSPLASGYLISRNTIFNNSIGIFLGSSGATPTLVTRNTIANNNAPGAASGTGIYSDVPLHNATINFNTFDNNDNEQINITPTGPSDTGITIQHNTFTGGNNSDIAFCPGCASGVNDSTISNNKITDPHDPAGGSSIFIGGTSSNDTLQRNQITSSNFNAIAIRDTAQGINIVSNRITAPLNNGIDVSSTASGAINATSNRITNAANVGINLAGGTTGNRLTSNHAKGSGSGFNCVDGSSPLANTWVNDHFAPSLPPGICQ
jgi:hypothetical protein